MSAISRSTVHRATELAVRPTGRVGGAQPGRKVLTSVCAIIAGGNRVDHVDICTPGRPSRVLGFRVMVPSTIGTFLRAFTFGHVRQLVAVADRVLIGCGT